MSANLIQAHYYQQFDAACAADVPASTYGGWKTAPIELAPQRTAFVLMHAWDCCTPEQYPGWYRAVEGIPRMVGITRTVLPRLLEAVRASSARLYHVAYPGRYYQHLPGYQRTRALVPHEEEPQQIEVDPSLARLRAFRTEHVFVGKHNLKDVRAAFEKLDFAPQTRPRDDERVVDTSAQLFAACRADGVNHLIYAGFTVNGCIVMMPGGMEDMRRHGILCSIIRQATTAIENHQTAREELAKQLGLWMVALVYGFVFDLDDIIAWLDRLPRRKRSEAGALSPA
ncbi:MAG TPA: hypothetical protein VF184_00130 [Phycisphaeraceae bacterium]